MCPPLLAALPAVFTAVSGFVSANAVPIMLAQAGVGIAAAVAQSEAQSKAYKENAVEARRAYTDDLEALNARDDEVNRSATDNVFQNEIAALEERGRARAGALGTADISLNEVLQNVNSRVAIARGNIETNRVGAIEQNRRAKRAAASSGNARINSVQRPSMTALGFDIAGSVLGAATTYSELKNRGA